MCCLLTICEVCLVTSSCLLYAECLSHGLKMTTTSFLCSFTSRGSVLITTFFVVLDLMLLTQRAGWLAGAFQGQGRRKKGALFSETCSTTTTDAWHLVWFGTEDHVFFCNVLSFFFWFFSP